MVLLHLLITLKRFQSCCAVCHTDGSGSAHGEGRRPRNDHQPMVHHSSMICGVSLILFIFFNWLLYFSKYVFHQTYLMLMISDILIPKMWLYVWKYHTQYTKRWCMTYKCRVMNHELRAAFGVLITCCIQQQDMSDVFIKSWQVEEWYPWTPRTRSAS